MAPSAAASRIRRWRRRRRRRPTTTRAATYEVSSAPESLWWRRGVDAFRGGYSAGVETLRSAAARLARSLLPGRAIGGDPTRGRRRRGGSVWGAGRGEREEAARRRAAEVERRSRSGGRTIKRARLTGRPAAGAASGGGGDRWAPLVGGFSRLGKAKKGSVPSASVGYVNPFACASRPFAARGRATW